MTNIVERFLFDFPGTQNPNKRIVYGIEIIDSKFRVCFNGSTISEHASIEQAREAVYQGVRNSMVQRWCDHHQFLVSVEAMLTNLGVAIPKNGEDFGKGDPFYLGRFLQ